MISYEKARSIIINEARIRGCKTEIITLQNAVGSVCVSKVRAPITIQPFDNSAMDGFALKYGSVSTLKKSMEIAAGDPVPDVE